MAHAAAAGTTEGDELALAAVRRAHPTFSVQQALEALDFSWVAPADVDDLGRGPGSAR